MCEEENRMNKQLRQLKQRLKNENQLDEAGNTEEADALADTKKGASEGAIESERKKILSTGKRFVRPLTMNPQRALKITGLIIAGLIIVITAAFAVLIYRYQSDSDMVYRASQIIPYPAACIGGSSQVLPYPSLCAGGEHIGYDDYLFELRTLKQYSQNPIGGGEGADFTTEEGEKQLESLRVSALSRVQQKAVVQQLADENGVNVPQEKVQERVDRFIKSEGGEEQLEDSLGEYYGWSIGDFKSEIRSQMLQQAIVRQKANQVLQKARAGNTDFAALAKKHSTDGSSQEGGDVGFVTNDSQFVDEFEKAALNLEKGEISGLVQTKFGFHILKATDKHPEKGTRISHILIDNSKLRNKMQNRLENSEKKSYIGVPIDIQNAQSQQQPGSGQQGETSQRSD